MATGSKSSVKRRLGRGLSSLVDLSGGLPAEVAAPEPPQPSVPVAPQASESSGGAGTTHVPHGTSDSVTGDASIDGERIVRLPLDLVVANPRQPRRDFDEKSLQELADSMKSAGLIQPIIVRRIEGGDRFELVAGERRWRAAGIVGLSDVAAIVRDLSDDQAGQWALIENIQREDLNPMERAWALRELGEMLGLSHGEIGERVGLDRSSVANLIRLTELEEDIQSMVRAGALGMGHARALLAAPAGAERVELAHRAAGEEWTVRRVEREAKALKQGRVRVQLGGAIGTEPSAALSDLERQLSEHFGTKVTITTNRAGDTGRISISFYGLDHFDGLMRMLGFEVK